MKKQGYWAIRTYVSGCIGEKTKYWVPGEKPTKSKRKLKSDIRKQTQNEADAVKRLARKLNANFRGGDCCFALTITQENLEKLKAKLPRGLTQEEERDAVYHLFEHEVEKFSRRYRERCKKLDMDYRYIIVVSDMDGETGEPARVHAHFIAPKAVADVIDDKWKLGEVRKKWLWDTPDYFDLAVYLLKQVRRFPDGKKYIPSRNLIIPQPKDRAALTDKEVQPPRGAHILYRQEFKPGRPQYIRYIIPEKAPRNSPPDEGGENMQV